MCKMTPETSPQTNQTLAILMILLTGVALAGMDVTAKYLTVHFPVLLVIWGRYFFHTALTFAACTAKCRSLTFLRARRPGLQLIRAAALFGTTSCIYVAIQHMPLGDAAAIQFFAPVLVTVISGLFLGEHVGVWRWTAIVVAFFGVLLIARPGFDGLGWAALLPFCSAVFLSIYMVMTRMIRDKDNADTTTFYSTAVGALVLTLVLPFFWQTPTLEQWALMVLMGALGASGHFLLIKALHTAEASLLAPFTYFHVVAAIFWGFLVFGDIPSLWMLGGTSIIICSGIFVWYREIKARKQKSR
ncbi:MAG: EamA family transporter [Rhodospirillaceae bacterium]|nr:MAG: EamA family transporter [Rhodospirillaceae bacterium]